MVVYHETASGALCSELRVVDDLTTCKKAAEALGYQFKTTEDEAGWPKGCYKSGGKVFFNQHVHGSVNINAAQICKDRGKGLRFFLTSIYLLTQSLKYIHGSSHLILNIFHRKNNHINNPKDHSNNPKDHNNYPENR